MATKTIAMALIMAGLWGAAAQAQPVTEGGCRTLADAVRSSVGSVAPRRGAWQPRARGSGARSAAGDALQTCGRTAAVASAAFAEAMAAMNLSIHWANREPGPGHVCRSHSLSQCYPGTLPGRWMSTGERAFVAAAWNGVCAGIRWQMPFGIASDISYFRPSSLDTSLAISLSATVDPKGRDRPGSGGSDSSLSARAAARDCRSHRGCYSAATVGGSCGATSVRCPE